MRLRELLVRRLLTWLGLWALCCVLVVFMMGRLDVKTEYTSASVMVDDLHRALFLSDGKREPDAVVLRLMRL